MVSGLPRPSPAPRTRRVAFEVPRATSPNAPGESEEPAWVQSWKENDPDVDKPKPAKTNPVAEYAQLWTGLGLLYAADFATKKAFVSAGIVFPSSLICMFAIAVLLTVVGEKAASPVRSFFAPALDWIAKWLPLFYVPALVTLPLALQGLAADDLSKMVVILLVGMVASLVFTAQVTMVIRNAVNTPTLPVAKGKPASPFTGLHYLGWGAVVLGSAAGIATGSTANLALPFMLGVTVVGYILGNAVPRSFQGILHPVLSTALAGNMGCAMYGALSGVGYEMAQKMYLAKGTMQMGSGDLLMSFLGSVILSMGFRIYDQRETMKRHAPEILGATFASSAFSFLSCALLAKGLALQTALSRALLPKCVTVALALPIATQLDAPLSLAAAGVLLNCLLCANFGLTILNAMGVKDTIARGLAMAGVGGGFGTAAIVSREPEALPFCALAYSMVGIFSTVLVTVPAVRALLLGIVG
uniref:LrgB-like protein n=1 Tax=Chlamydomonas euryale TaxID=1486919 RepID=A0A7R9VAA3_9CHLO